MESANLQFSSFPGLPCNRFSGSFPLHRGGEGIGGDGDTFQKLMESDDAVEGQPANFKDMSKWMRELAGEIGTLASGDIPCEPVSTGGRFPPIGRG